MDKHLPKGHVSCLCSTFRYTPAAETSVGNTFARVRRRLENHDRALAVHIRRARPAPPR
jgi:hypothetical protein